MDISPGYPLLNPTALFPRSVQVQEQNDRFHTVWRGWTNMCNQTLAASVFRVSSGLWQWKAQEGHWSRLGCILLKSRQNYLSGLATGSDYSDSSHHHQAKEQAGIYVLSSVLKQVMSKKKCHFHLVLHMNSLVLPDPDTLATWCRTTWMSFQQ